MKILFTRFPLESAYGGAEVQTLSLMEGLLKRGHAVAFAGSCPVLLEECRKRSIPVIELDIGPPPVTSRSAVTFLWKKNTMKKQLELMLSNFGRLDVICMLSLSEKLLLTHAASVKGIRTAWIEHDRIGRWLTHNPWLPMLLRNSQQAITVPVSALSGRIYTELGWHHGTVKPIPNGIDTKRLGMPFQRARSNAEQPLRLGCVARLSREKGIDVLIEAMAAVPEYVRLEIVGEGPEEHVLRALAEKLELKDRITFSKPSPDVRGIYEQFDALVLPSRDNDPFGLAAAEAMTLGLPVIVTDACGIAEYLEPGKDALIAQAGLPSSLAKEIIKLLRPEIFTALATNAPVYAAEKFSVEMMVNRYETVFTGGNPS